MIRPARRPHPARPTGRPVQVWALMLTVLLAVMLPGTPARAAGEGTPAGSAGVDPKDGPDIDLRFELREDRVRVLATPNLAFVDFVTELPREREDYLAPEEEGGARIVVEEMLAEHLKVRVDGVERSFETVEFLVEPGDPNIALYPRFGSRASTKLRLVSEAPLDAVPTRLSLTWSSFPPDLKLYGPDKAPPMAISAQLNDGLFDYPLQFTVEEPEYVWVGQLRDPGEALLPVPEPAPAKALQVSVLSSVLLFLAVAQLALLGLRRERILRHLLLTVFLAICAFQLQHTTLIDTPFTTATEPPTEADARAIFEPLHRNVYTAFAYDSESDIYDALAGSVGGELLDSLYVQVFRSLKLPDEGHGLARVQQVRHRLTTLESSGVLPGTARPSFTVRAQWEVDGSITHFGHSHERTNEYDARFTVAMAEADADADGWRLVGHELLESRVVETRTDGQRFGPGGEALGSVDGVPEGEL